MEQDRRAQRSQAAAIRMGDQRPYTALRWVSTLFKSAAVFLVVAIVAEFIAGIRAEGWAALPFLLGEVARAVVLAIVLWAGGDLVRLLLQIGRDLRAERVLLARIAYRMPPLDGRSGDTAPLRRSRDILIEGRLSDDVDLRAVAPEGLRASWGRVDPVTDDGEAPRTGEAAA
jgi:hypothetical protein